MTGRQRTVGEALADLEARLRQTRAGVLESMTPGRDPAEAIGLLAMLEPVPDPGLVSLYSWHDGGDEDLISGARFMSLQEAVESRDFELSLARDIEFPELPASRIFDPRWFPILQESGGMVYVVEDFGRGRVLLFDRLHIGNPEVLSASLVDFLDAIARDGFDFKPGPLTEDVRTLVGRLESDDSEELWSAVRELTRKRPAEAYEPLVAMLDSTRPLARREAALLLGALGDPRAVPVLTRYLGRSTGDEVTSARAALAELGE